MELLANPFASAWDVLMFIIPFLLVMTVITSRKGMTNISMSHAEAKGFASSSMHATSVPSLHMMRCRRRHTSFLFPD